MVAIIRAANGAGICLGVFVGKKAVTAGTFCDSLLDVFYQLGKFFGISFTHTQYMKCKSFGLSAADAGKGFKISDEGI
jgi:hypothetical protein